jgi:hypothetical protein
MIIHRFLGLLIVILFVLAVAPPSEAAERVEHRTQIVPFNETVMLEGEEAVCFEGADELILTGTDVYRITEVISGPNTGSMHIKFKSEGTFHALTGDTTIATGTLRATLNVKTHRGTRHLNFSEMLIGTTVDGEPVKYMLHTHFTLRDGELTRAIVKPNCIQ